MMQHSLRAAPSIKKRAKSVYQQRNLGTIKNRKKEKLRAELRAQGVAQDDQAGLNATAFANMTDKENPNFVYVY